MDYNFPPYVIMNLQSTDSRNEKELLILEEAVEGNKEFFKGLYYGLSTYVTFGVKDIPEGIDEDAEEMPFEEFESKLLKPLMSRELSGNAAREALVFMSMNTNADQWNYWYRLILQKDFRAGITEKTVNAALTEYPEFQIPVFQCQLAHDGNKFPHHMAGRKIVDTKMDGVRVLAVVQQGSVELLSRTGKPLNNFLFVEAHLSHIAQFIPCPMVFDGEMMGSSFSDLMTRLRRKEVEAYPDTFYVFDCIPLSDFMRGYCATPQNARRRQAMTLLSPDGIESKFVKVLDFEEVDLSSKEGYERFKQINKAAVDNGYEGIMVKDPVAPYESKRTTSWLKIKPFIEVTMQIVGIHEGTGKASGMMGSLECVGEHDGKIIKSFVGGGFSDKDREQFWEEKEQFLGEWIEVKADAVTETKEGYSLRFPRFKGLRSINKEVI